MACTIAVVREGLQRNLVRTFQALRVASPLLDKTDRKDAEHDRATRPLGGTGRRTGRRGVRPAFRAALCGGQKSLSAADFRRPPAGRHRRRLAPGTRHAQEWCPVGQLVSGWTSAGGVGLRGVGGGVVDGDELLEDIRPLHAALRESADPRAEEARAWLDEAQAARANGCGRTAMHYLHHALVHTRYADIAEAVQGAEASPWLDVIRQRVDEADEAGGPLHGPRPRASVGAVGTAFQAIAWNAGGLSTSANAPCSSTGCPLRSDVNCCRPSAVVRRTVPAAQSSLRADPLQATSRGWPNRTTTATEATHAPAGREEGAASRERAGTPELVCV